MRTVVALGAEAQAATSLASAYPERRVTFVSDRAILDGSDLPNVRMVLATPSEAERLSARADITLPLCGRWLPNTDNSLRRVFGRLEAALPGRALPIVDKPTASGRWIAKGDRWRRPDGPLSGNPEQLADIVDQHGCGLVYQPYREASATMMTVGRRAEGSISLGVLTVLQERFFRDAVLQAAETIDDPELVDLSLQVLDALHHRGFFTLNWLRTEDGLRLSSFRPVPRAVFRAFRRGGVDLLAEPSGVAVVAPSLRLIADPTYVSYPRLDA